MSAYGDTRTRNRCIEGLSKVFTVQLHCSVDERIHVEYEAYGDGDAVTCRLASAESCSKKLASSRHGLVVNCNGKQSCRETMQVQTINNCNITAAAAEVNYNCIKGSMNMCSPVTTTVNRSVYLHSPGFPDSVGVNRSCVARVTGQNIEAALVEQRMRSGTLDISRDGRQLWTNVNVNQYNKVLPDLAAEIVIVYDNHDQDGSNVWIRVADSGQMNVKISGEILDSSSTSTSTQQPPRSQSTSSPSTSDTPRTETAAHSTSIGNIWDIVIALSVVCGILVLINVVLVIYFMLVKPFRKKNNTSPKTGTPVGHGETNVYYGIQRNTSDSGDEHNYVHITSSEGPFYANFVSGDDPYVNT
ncbi:uncharacterized protein LOC124274629 [Haliotis rubra]|uniref:uncharacterized protein LOC124274629 n=1 Tax=Haliotis rubra TaxID=36100 RepID=UPI001EE53F20|nr:uncharacterized protein LOC124274629 [Haliotis rubra]